MSVSAAASRKLFTLSCTAVYWALPVFTVSAKPISMMQAASVTTLVSSFVGMPQRTLRRQSISSPSGQTVSRRSSINSL